MKKCFFLLFILVCTAMYGNAQMSVYLRLTDYGNKVLTTGGTTTDNITPITNTIEPASNQLMKVSAYSADIEQSLSLTSTSSGSGAGVGRVTFNPISVTKTMDATSPVLLQNCASGTPYKTVEVFFVNAQNQVMNKQTYKMVGVKTVAWSAACATGCDGVKEIVTFEYGSDILTINKGGGEGIKFNIIQAGWNAIKNISDNDPTTILTK